MTMWQEKPFRDYACFLQRHFEGKVQKLPVDAGFTCPNRDGSKGVGGCVYCNNQSFSTSYCHPSLSVIDQLTAGMRYFAGKYPNMQYVAYFQAHTGTYAPLERLKALYEEALAVDGVVGIVIATRPDCVSDELLDYLQSLSQRTFVMIEYGVETLCDRTLAAINRCHDSTTATDAIRRTAQRGIAVGVHLILGLSGETEAEMMATTRTISALPVDVVKYHQLQVIRGTRLGREVEAGTANVKCFSVDEYVALVARVIGHLSDGISVERIVSESPGDLLISPKWGMKPQEVTRRLVEYMHENDIFQGKFL